ncbi:MAG: PstS family phosphate ABC transporter substrate-binding protein, partial [Gammaproteobacteria bacterium]
MHTRNLMSGAALAISMAIAGAAQAAEAPKVDPNLPEYTPTAGVSGNLSSIGSDTMNNLMTLWAEDFAKFYPNVNVQIQGAGSSTAPPAVTEGTANFGPMSRMMKGKEIESFE